MLSPTDTSLATTTAGEDLLVPVQKAGKLLRERIKDAAAARKVFGLLRDADKPAAEERARVQAMTDGVPPQNPAVLAASGLAEICNVNWGDGERVLSMAMSPYLDLTTSVDFLITTPTNFGEPQERAEIETVIAEEFTRMVRSSWLEFTPRVMQLVHQFLQHGTAFAAFDDDIDWRFNAVAMGDMLVPRNTRASDEEIEVACMKAGFAPHKLLEKVLDPARAKEVGWDVTAVKKALTRAVRESSGFEDSPERQQMQWKNNDLAYACSQTASVVPCVFMWVRELNGSVSFYIFEEKGDEKGFLYKATGRFESMAQVLVSFTYGIGTNGTFHSVRGLGAKIFSIVQAINRLRCRTYDGMMRAAMQMLSVASEDVMEDMAVTHFGPYMLLPQGATLVEGTIPNYSQTLFPGLNDLSSMLNQQTGQYSPEAIFNQGRERSKYEVQQHLESLSNISIAQLSLFYEPWQRLLKEVLSRAIRPNYFETDPGGRLILDMRNRIVERGIPIEALFMVDVTKASVVRAIGNGSSAARSAIVRQLFEISQQFDPQGQRQIVRDLTRTIGGVEAADRYAPAPENMRPPQDLKLAMLENASLRTGAEIPVLPNELHAVHLPVHLQLEEEVFHAVDSGQALLEDVMGFMLPLHQHTSAHAENMIGHPDFPMIKQRLQQLNELIWNGTKRMADLQRDAEAAAQAGQPVDGQPENATPANPSGAPDTMQRQLAELTARLTAKEEEHQQRMRHREELQRQTMALKDAATAADMTRKNLTQGI